MYVPLFEYFQGLSTKDWVFVDCIRQQYADEKVWDETFENEKNLS